MKTRRSVPSWVPTLFFVMGNLLIIGASAQLIRLGYIPLPGLIAAFFWGETWVFWGITDLLGWPWRLKRVGAGGPVEERVSAADRAHSDHHRGAHHASLPARAHAGLSAVPVGDCGGGLAAYNIRCQYPGSW